MICAIADKNAEDNECIDEIPVIKPEEICKYKYDYIVIFSKQYFFQIVNELVWNYSIDCKRIISYTQILMEQKFVSDNYTMMLHSIIQERNLTSVLDTSDSAISDYFLNKNQLIPDRNIIIGYMSSVYEEIDQNVYDFYYPKIMNMSQKYEFIIFWKWTAESKKILETVCEWKCFFVLNQNLMDETWDDELRHYGIVEIIPTVNGTGYLVERCKMIEKKEDVTIYVVTHKEYSVLCDDLYKPLCVGSKYSNPDYLTEKVGLNISHLNEKINECTALYWIWKNTEEQIVGLCHYRRYFCSADLFYLKKPIQEKKIIELLNEYDIIVPQATSLADATILQQLENTIPDKNAFLKGYEVIKEQIAKKQPKYIAAFDRAMKKKLFYPYNMFITTREILNNYCEWFFSFIIDAAELMDVEQYDNYSKRVIGFFAERMMTVWLMEQRLKVKELPVWEL